MTELSPIILELSRKIGSESPPLTEEVEKGAIRKFVQATGDTNLLWQDCKDVVAPPTFFCTLKYLERLSLDVPLPHLLAAEDEFHFYKPLRPNDEITSRQRLADIYEKSGRLGPMLFVVLETTFVNQRDELTGLLRHTSIYY